MVEIHGTVEDIYCRSALVHRSTAQIVRRKNRPSSFGPRNEIQPELQTVPVDFSSRQFNSAAAKTPRTFEERLGFLYIHCQIDLLLAS